MKPKHPNVSYPVADLISFGETHLERENMSEDELNSQTVDQNPHLYEYEKHILENFPPLEKVKEDLDNRVNQISKGKYVNIRSKRLEIIDQNGDVLTVNNEEDVRIITERNKKEMTKRNLEEEEKRNLRDNFDWDDEE